jgi:GNAT superfamily N-acetyltransferase
MALEQSETYRIGPARPSQRAAASELLHLTFGGGVERWRNRLAHATDQNPAWHEGIPPGWAATGADGRLAGYMMNTPFLFRGSGRPLLCCAVHTLAVDPGARGGGIARRLAEAAMQQECDFLVGTQTSPGGWNSLVAAGMKPLPEPWTGQPHLIAGDLAALARLAATRTGWLPRPIAAAAGGLAGKLMRGAEKLLSCAPPGIEVRPLVTFIGLDPSALEAFVARCAPLRPVRDPGTLEWMYFGTGDLRRSRVVLGAWADGRLVGYCGLRRLPGSAALLECRADPDCIGAASALLAAARRWAVGERLSHILVYPYAPKILQALPRLASFRIRKQRPFTFLLHLKCPGIQVSDLELGTWDGDAVTTDDAPALDGVAHPGAG